jgi:hypothetical protein
VVGTVGGALEMGDAVTPAPPGKALGPYIGRFDDMIVGADNTFHGFSHRMLTGLGVVAIAALRACPGTGH